VRKAQGLSLREASRRAGIDAAHLSRIERGESSPSAEALARLASVLGLRTLAELLDPYTKLPAASTADTGSPSPGAARAGADRGSESLAGADPGLAHPHGRCPPASERCDMPNRKLDHHALDAELVRVVRGMVQVDKATRRFKAILEEESQRLGPGVFWLLLPDGVRAELNWRDAA
jgi:hypothetical protein